MKTAMGTPVVAGTRAIFVPDKLQQSVLQASIAALGIQSVWSCVAQAYTP